MTILMMTISLAFTVACSSEDAKDAASSVTDAASNAAASAQDGAKGMMDHAGDAAHSMADSAKDAAQGAADAATGAAGSVVGAVSGNVVTACQNLAESGDWGKALEVCKKAHEMMPDDLALEHAYQQAQAAAN